eukprot:RCo006620
MTEWEEAVEAVEEPPVSCYQVNPEAQGRPRVFKVKASSSPMAQSSPPPALNSPRDGTTPPAAAAAADAEAPASTGVLQADSSTPLFSPYTSSDDLPPDAEEFLMRAFEAEVGAQEKDPHDQLEKRCRDVLDSLGAKMNHCCMPQSVGSCMTEAQVHYWTPANKKPRCVKGVGKDKRAACSNALRVLAENASDWLSSETHGPTHGP